MNNFELNERIEELVDTQSAYQLAKMVVEYEELLRLSNLLEEIDVE